MSTPAAAARPWEAEDYLAAVGRRLADLPAEERSALLEDLALHLEALRAEDDDRSIAARLGPADAYAAELRAAAGLPPQAAGPELVGNGVRQRAAALLAHPWTGEVRRLLVELRPGWWVLRGYLLVLVPCALAGDASDFPVPEPLGSHVLGVLAVLAAITGSVALGRQQPTRPARVLLVAGGVLLGALGFGVALDAPSVAEGGSGYGYAVAPVVDQAIGEYPLVSRYGPVTDVLPYAADGTPLEDVLLYDQDGRPLQVGFQEWWADGCVRELRQPLAADGVPVPNVFPQTYVVDPAPVDAYGVPVETGQCDATSERPEVPLPVFPPAAAAAGAAAAAAAGVTEPAPGE